MCEFCDEGDDASIDRAALTPEFVARMRAIEAAMPGEPLPERTWQIYLGAASGALAWPCYERILASRAAASSAQRVVAAFSHHRRRASSRGGRPLLCAGAR